MKATFWDLVDRIREKAITVRAIADVLSVVDTQDLEPDTVRSLGMLILAEIAGILAALDGLQ
jgi:hypothetical protein